MTAPNRRRTVRASFEEIAEAIPHIVWLADADGSTDYLNERGADYTGLPKQAAYGWGWVNLVHPADAERAVLAWEYATQTATPFELSYRLRRADGAFRWHAFRALPLRGRRCDNLRWIGTADDLDDTAVAVDEGARIELQIAQLRTMLEVVQPAEGARFGFAGPEQRRARVMDVLGSGDREFPSASARSMVGDLAARELAVARLVATGYTNAEIANLLGLSLRSIETSRARLRQCTGIRTRAGLVRFARDAGLVEPGG